MGSTMKFAGKVIGGAFAASLVIAGASPALGVACLSGNMCSYENINYGGLTWMGASGTFVEVPDDRASSAHNYTAYGYYAKNNAAFAQEETLAYIPKGQKHSSFSGWNDMVDHYRR
ncbi:hypothetical protein [Neomicrococcus aestuarii]|uniref:Peptidase inhibitor family I36 n=1 Tax=Neomicrococcus aestuarii TaxID=556325 RepID=A0A1L2ZPM8_9MICC|nr:hypothetical protein [Neomicrococcus aestuarii]APF41089.1 hypothetical protein BHE16_08860 [Neomicrococcus aestuarii]